jgi:hypothetical protein
MESFYALWAANVEGIFFFFYVILTFDGLLGDWDVVARINGCLILGPFFLSILAFELF